jgi:hypothetical protein
MESLRMRRNMHVSRLFYQGFLWLGREDSNLRIGNQNPLHPHFAPQPATILLRIDWLSLIGALLW